MNDSQMTASAPVAEPLCNPLLEAPSRGQRHERLLQLQHRSTFESRADAVRLGDAAMELAADRHTITGLHYRVRPRVGGFRLDLRWTYGWVKGGWPSDGQRFVRLAGRRAGVEPADELLSILEEDKRPVHQAYVPGLESNLSANSDAWRPSCSPGRRGERSSND